MAEYWVRQELTDLVNVTQVAEPIPQDSEGDTFGVEIAADREISGDVDALVTYPGGSETVEGTLSGNRASVELPEAAYDRPGKVVAAIRITDGASVTTVGCFTAMITEGEQNGTD